MKSSRKLILAGGLGDPLAPLQRRLGEIEYRSVAKVTAYVNNPRRHPEKQIVKLMASISHFGIPLPILVDSEDVIIAGHAVVEAARRLGLTDPPVLVTEYWSKAQVKAYRLADNRIAELGCWDKERLASELLDIIQFDESPIELLGWDAAEIDVILDGDTRDAAGANPADEILETPAKPATRAGDLWLLGKHRLLCGSFLEPASWRKLMAGDTAAMVFTDAPYNVAIDKHVCGLGKIKHDEFAMASGEMSKDEFTEFLAYSIEHAAFHLKDGGVLTLAMDWRHSTEILSAIESNKLALLNMCVWNKNNGSMGSLYPSKHELFWIAKKGKAPHTNNVELGKHGRYRTNVWDYAGVNSFGKSRMSDLADHPTVKPIALVVDAIRDVTRPGEVVIDGFMGSGTTILAAERTKRLAYGIEIAPGYVDVAITRWQAMSGTDAVLAGTDETFSQVASRRAAASDDEAGRESFGKLSCTLAAPG